MSRDTDRRNLIKTSGVVFVGLGVRGVGSAEGQEGVATGITVYVGSNDGNVYALDAETGDEQWNLEIGTLVELSPTVVDGIVYIGSSDLPGSTVYALDAETGDEQWSFETDGKIESSPTVVADPATGDSIDSHVKLGTLGHHHVWAERASDGELDEDNTGSEGEEEGKESSGSNSGAEEGEGLPGFTIVTTLFAFAVGIVAVLRREYADADE